MALRAVSEHPKFAEFKTLLSLPKGAALGWLEAMWHFAGRFTPCGDIGKYSDIQIEAWVEWSGAPGSLVKALTESGWIDVSQQYRLVVHDWHVHADNATKLSVKRSGKSFCIDTKSTLSPPQQQCEHGGEEIPTSLGLPVPVPEPVPGAGAVVLPFVPTITDQANAATLRVMQEAPLSGMKVRMAIEQTARHEISSGREPEQVADAMLAAWKAFSDAKGKLEYVWGAEKFFGEGNWKDDTAWPWKEGQQPARKNKASPDNRKPIEMIDDARAVWEREREGLGR